MFIAGIQAATRWIATAALAKFTVSTRSPDGDTLLGILSCLDGVETGVTSTD